jgi:hypothetical protein
MTELNSPEPSMEEILASIRRIISEDLASVEPAGAAAEDEVLILRERAPPVPDRPWAHDPPASEPAPEPVIEEPYAAPEPEAKEQLEAAEQPEVEGEPATESPSAEAVETEHHHEVPAVVATDRALVAPGVAMSAAASFERLYFVVETPPPSAPSVAISTSGPTLEDVTRELLKPLIQAWLDENLDAIVRARVDEEVERISRGRAR